MKMSEKLLKYYADNEIRYISPVLVCKILGCPPEPAPTQKWELEEMFAPCTVISLWKRSKGKVVGFKGYEITKGEQVVKLTPGDNLLLYADKIVLNKEDNMIELFR
jgi:hypothetical protein